MLAAYNAQFDLLFLYAFLQKYGDARLLQEGVLGTGHRGIDQAVHEFLSGREAAVINAD